MRGLTHFKRSSSPSNGMDAPRSAGAPVSSPAAAQRCAEGAGLDSGVLAAAQSAMLSIAAPAAMIADMISTRAAAFDGPSATARIYTRLTDVTSWTDNDVCRCPTRSTGWSWRTTKSNGHVRQAGGDSRLNLRRLGCVESRLRSVHSKGSRSTAWRIVLRPQRRYQALRLWRTAARLRGLTAALWSSVGHPCRSTAQQIA